MSTPETIVFKIDTQATAKVVSKIKRVTALLQKMNTEMDRLKTAMAEFQNSITAK